MGYRRIDCRSERADQSQNDKADDQQQYVQGEPDYGVDKLRAQMLTAGDGERKGQVALVGEEVFVEAWS